jgi:mono/diheme cytochrome c family protein
MQPRHNVPPRQACGPARILLIAVLGAAAAWSGSAAEPPAKIPPDHAERLVRGQELFTRHVRPVLVDNCLKCHGGEKTKSDLDLSTREGLLRGGAGGPAVELWNGKASRLIRLLAHQEEPHMPAKAPRLGAEQLAQIATWIDLGAPYDRPLTKADSAIKQPMTVTDRDRQFWSFQPLQHPSLPPVKNDAWCRTPIDRFILAGLEAKGLAPNPPVDRRRLIRRASFDLVGLPPTPEEVEAFVHDPAPDAYERLIDRLLASPHYGERWARHWLDVARFAESHGFEHDYDRPNAYHYRDFVIRALNQDLPYDTFVKWQIAGDELEPDNPQALMATGFLAAGVHSTQITQKLVEKERYDELDDMTRTLGTAMLGLTIGCARCHDHKYDPIPTRDYYRMVAAFTTTVRSDVDVSLDGQADRQARAKFDAEHTRVAEPLRRYEAEELPKKLDAWLAARPLPLPPPRWVLLDPVRFESRDGATFTKLGDGSLLAGGKNPDHDTHTFVVHTDLKGITAVRIEALAHPSLVRGGPGRAGNGNFALSEFTLTAAPRNGTGQPVRVKLVHPKATFEQQGLPVKAAIDGDRNSAWAVDPQFGKDHAAVFETETDIGFDGGTVLTFTLEFNTNTGHGIGRPRLALSTAPRPVGLDGDGIPQEVQPILARLDADRGARLTAEQRAALLRWYRTLDPEWRRLNQQVEDHARTAPRPTVTKVLICSEGVTPVRLHSQGADFFEQTYFLKRGDPNQKDGVAPPGFLQVLLRAPDGEKRWQAAPPPGGRTSYRRRALAGWITDVEQGAGALLARVIVNRLWQHHLGRGIVGTPSDFGFQGERPTHPELLDWLARDLIANGWRLNPIHKRILLSAAYQQSAAADRQKAAVDPDNRLFGRNPRRRLEAEVIRDAILAVSGTLDERMHGPGTLDPAQKRRSIYFFVKRSKLVPTMVLFDAPDALQGIDRRPATTVAPQALLLLNNPTVRGCAESFARRISPRDDTALADTVRAGYRSALGRQPADGELADSVQFLQEQIESYQADKKGSARQLALADFCQVLLGLNEFIYVD